MTGDDFYRSIPLTEEEIEAALLEGKKKKYFHEKNKDYWQEQESRNGKTPVTKENVCAGTDRQTPSDLTLAM